MLGYTKKDVEPFIKRIGFSSNKTQTKEKDFRTR